MVSGYDSRVRLLDAADRLMYERGYEAVGVAELCRVAEVKKGSFYFFFDSKQALAIEMLDRAWERTRSTIFAHSLADDTKGAVDAIDAYGHLLADNLERVEADSGVVTGCRFGNFAIELSTRDEEVRVRLASIFDEMIAIAASAIGRGVGSGELDPRTDPVAAATDVIVHMEGLMVLAKAHRRPALLRNLGPTIARLLAIQSTPTGSDNR